MGMGVAKTLLRSGFTTYVRDLLPEREQEAAKAGAVVCATPRELARHCDVIITLVVDDRQTDAVLFGTDGAAPALKPDDVVVMCSTVAPRYAAGLGARLQKSGILMLDAPVSGGPAKAHSAEMSMMAAGPRAAFARCREVLSAITGKLFRISANPGDGSKMKIVNNMLAGMQLVAAAEALTLAAKLGLNSHTVYDVVCGSSGASWVFADRMARVLADDYAPRAALDILKKDLTIALASAQENGAVVSLANCALEVFRAAAASGYGVLDDAALVKHYEQRSGVRIDISRPDANDPLTARDF